MRMTVYYDGNEDDLKDMLEHGVRVSEIKLLKKGYSVMFEDRRHKGVGRPSSYTDQQLDGMYRAYLEGDSFTGIAAAFGCSRQYVSRIVKARQAENRKNRLKGKKGEE